MESNIVGAILFIIAFFLGFYACIPPLKQSITDKFKPGIVISILLMLIMLILIIAMVFKLNTWLA